MIKNIFLLFITFAYFNFGFTKNFIISNSNTKNQRSKNSIKESIGFEIKDVLDRFADLNKKIAQIQIEISNLQKRLVEKSGKLIENKRPFKRASRNGLTKTLKALQNTEKTIADQLILVNNLKKEFNNNDCLTDSKKIKV